jgi:uncharacterized protein
MGGDQHFMTEYPGHDARELCAVAIMAKESVAGQVKTRLVPPLTFNQAAELNTCFLQDMASNIAAAAMHAPIQGFASYDPLGSERFFKDHLPRDFKLLAPREPTIGRSLFHAARDLLGAGYSSVCLVNSDSPTLPTERLVETVRRLNQVGDRVVLGPSADGGYYLIGLKHFHARLFESIDWSTERVYRQTVARAAEIGLEVFSLPEWYDVDDATSFAMLLDELRSHSDAACPYRGGFHAPQSSALVKRLTAESRESGPSYRLGERTKA